MKKLFSTGYSSSAFNLALFILRVGAGILMIHHGYDKLVHFNQYSQHFIHFLGMSAEVSLSLAIFAEFFCAIFIMLGLFTRLAAIPLVIDVSVAVAKGHDMEIFGKGELPSLFVLMFITILILGPGRISIDGIKNK
jgi:putative oxidoreductase